MAGPAAAVAVESTLDAEAVGASGAGRDERGDLGLNLADLIEMASANPIVGAALADLDVHRARLGQAVWAPWSGFSASALFTAIPEQRGLSELRDGTLTRYAEDPQWSAVEWGPYVRLGLSGAIPIWTFGKLSSAREAAEAGVEAGRGGVERARHMVRSEVRRAYLSLLLAREILLLISDGRGYIDEARDEIRARIDRGEGGAAMIDIYKLDALTADVDARELQARRLEDVALAGLRMLAGVDAGVRVADVTLGPFPIERRPVAEYVEMAGRGRPDLRALRAAAEAQRAKLRIERARYYPDLALGVTLGYAYSNVADDQHNPWLSDPYNYATYGAALLLDCPLDFGMDYWRVDEAEAALRRVEEQVEVLSRAVEAEVSDAYAAIVETQARTRAYDAGRTAAKRWLIAVLQGMTLGLHEAGDLTDALIAYFSNEANYLSAVWDLNVAWVRLAFTTGGDFLDGLEPRE